MNAAALDACAATVRRADPDRFFSALFAPAAKRPYLLALYALNHELARVAESVREPMLGQIRLQWWREAILSAREGKPRRHEVAEAMASLFDTLDVPSRLLDAMVDARAFDIATEEFATFHDLESYLDATSGNLMRIAALIMELGDRHDALAQDAGIAYGLAGILRAIAPHGRRRKLFLPLEALAAEGLSAEDVYAVAKADRLKHVVRAVASRASTRYGAAHARRAPGYSLAAFLPAALVPLYLTRVTRMSHGSMGPEDPPLYRRQAVLLASALRGRV
jgi:phytoene/squalene synthetase